VRRPLRSIGVVCILGTLALGLCYALVANSVDMLVRLFVKNPNQKFAALFRSAVFGPGRLPLAAGIVLLLVDRYRTFQRARESSRTRHPSVYTAPLDDTSGGLWDADTPPRRRRSAS
jgi:hypothetical protein